jgi:hypothetical protein
VRIDVPLVKVDYNVPGVLRESSEGDQPLPAGSWEDNERIRDGFVRTAMNLDSDMHAIT